MVAVAGIIMLLAARFAFQSGDIGYFTFNRGIIFPSPNLWIADHWLTMVVNTALVLMTALSWMFLIQLFNPFRAFTTLPASFYVIMIMAVPDLMDQLFTGTVLAAVIPLCLSLLWSSFADISRLRLIFLLFVILSALTMTQYCFAFYIPVFIIGCAQMKIFSLRTVLAIIFGIVTPWWIVLGSGLFDFNSLHAPEMTDFFKAFNLDGTLNIILASALTAVLFIVCWFANIMKVITLNANLRAFNGSISLIALFTLIAMMADFTNVAAYLPTLMLVTSYQASYSFGSAASSRSFIAPLVIMLAYIGVYIMRIFL